MHPDNDPNPDVKLLRSELATAYEQRDTYLEQLKQCQAELARSNRQGFWSELLSPCAGDQPNVEQEQAIRQLGETMHQMAENAFADELSNGPVEVEYIEPCALRNQQVGRAHPHYYIDVSRYTHVDIYRLIELLGVADPVAQHVFKKAAATGKRGHKDLRRDWQDIRDSAARRLEMMDEDAK